MKVNRVVLCILALFLITAVSCLGLFFRSSGCGSGSGFTTGERTVMSGNIERVYYLKLPENYDSKGFSYPLVFFANK